MLEQGTDDIANENDIGKSHKKGTKQNVPNAEHNKLKISKKLRKFDGNRVIKTVY